MDTVKQNRLSIWLRALAGLALVFGLAVLAWQISKQVAGLSLPFGIPGKTLEYPLWAVLLGMLAGAILRPVKGVDFVRPGLRTELFLKTGLVLLGAGINLKLLVTAAGGAVLQAILLITSVFFFSYWLAGKFGLDDKLRAVMSTALAV